MTSYSFTTLTKMIFSFIFCLVLFSTTLNAALVKGQIVDIQSDSAITQANIYLIGTDSKTQSDHQGNFQIEVESSGDFQLRITHVAFETYLYDFNISDEDLEVTIPLIFRLYYSGEIVVTGTRSKYLLKDVPVTTEVIYRDDVLLSGATTVDEALDIAVGVNIDENLSGVGVSLRGLDPTRVLILIDSEKIVGRVRGAIDLSQIALSNVEKIEIVKGSGATLYGSEAIGGVVNIITKKPTKHTNISFISEYSTYASYSQMIEINGSYKNWLLQVGGKYDRTDGFDLIEETTHTNGQEEIRHVNIDAKIAKRLSRIVEFNIKGSFFSERKYWLESEYIDPIEYSFNDEENNYRYSGGVKVMLTPNANTYIDVNLYSTYYDHLWEKFFLSTLNDKSRTEESLNEISVVATHTYAPGHVITTGGDLTYQSLKSDEIQAGKQSVNNSDLYMQYEWKPLENLVFLPGIRLEEHSTFGSHLNASINLMYNPIEPLRIRSLYSGGFRAPSIKEIYFNFDHSAAGYRVDGGGENLKPETSRNFSTTFEYSYAGIGMHRITYFYNKLDNLIEFDLVRFSEKYWRGEYQYMNVFRAYTKGLEWESQVRINHSMKFSLSYTWLIAKNSQTGYWLLNRPEHSLKFRYSLNLKSLGVNLTAWGNWYSKKLWTPLGAQNDFDSEIWAPTRRTLNVSVVKSFFNFMEVIGRIENITDDIEVDFGYWPGRTYHLGININMSKSKS